MLTIGFDAKRLYQNFTGLGNYSRSLVNDLKRLYPEHQYHLYSPGFKKRPSTLPFLESKHFENHIYKGVLGSWWRTYGIVKELNKDKIDIYHGLSHELPEGIERIKTNSVVTMHDMVIKKHPDLFPWMDRKIYEKKFASACARADHIIAISDSTKNDVIEAYGVEEERITTVYQTCDPIFWQRYTTEQIRQVLSKYSLPGEYLLYVGSVIERKNLLNLAKAVVKLPRSIALPLVVVGEGKKYFDKVKSFVKEIGMPDRFIFIRPHFSELPMIYSGARVFIYPSIYEGFGIPILEAHCCQTPVITTELSSLPEAGGPGAVYVDPFNVEDITGRLKAVIQDNTLREKMLAASQEHIKQFTADGVTGKVMDIYQSLVKK